MRYNTRTQILVWLDHRSMNSGAGPLASNASQSAVPVGSNPIDLHFHRPTARVRMLHNRYTTFCKGNTVSDFASGGVLSFGDGLGANGAKAAFIPAIALNGFNNSINTIPMLNICTPPPDMYSMNACIGSDLAGEMAKSHARFSLSALCEADEAATALVDGLATLVFWAKPGGGGKCLHLEVSTAVEDMVV